MTIHDRHDVQRPEDPLDHDVHREQDRREKAALREHEPPEQVSQRRLLDGFGLCAHLPNPIRTAPMTIDATSHAPNCEATTSPDGTGSSITLKWRITPASRRNVMLWYSANSKQITLKTTKGVELGG